MHIDDISGTREDLAAQVIDREGFEARARIHLRRRQHRRDFRQIGERADGDYAGVHRQGADGCQARRAGIRLAVDVVNGVGIRDDVDGSQAVDLIGERPRIQDEAAVLLVRNQVRAVDMNRVGIRQHHACDDERSYDHRDPGTGVVDDRRGGEVEIQPETHRLVRVHDQRLVLVEVQSERE